MEIPTFTIQAQKVFCLVFGVTGSDYWQSSPALAGLAGLYHAYSAVKVGSYFSESVYPKNLHPFP